MWPGTMTAVLRPLVHGFVLFVVVAVVLVIMAHKDHSVRSANAQALLRRVWMRQSDDDFEDVFGMLVVTFENARNGPTVGLNFHPDGGIPSNPFTELHSGESHTVWSEAGSVWSAWIGNQQVAIWRVGEEDNQHFYISEEAARWQLTTRAPPSKDQQLVLSGWEWASRELGRKFELPPTHSPPFEGLFSKEECEQLMEFLDGASELWSDQEDSVDKLPENQLDMFGKDIGKPVGTPRVSYDPPIDALIQRILRAGQWYLQDETLQLSWLFARKYAPGERYNLQTHPDQCRLTATILLNGPESFRGHGGEYYIAGAEEFIAAQEPLNGDPDFEKAMEGKSFLQLREADLEAIVTSNPQWVQPQHQGAAAFHTAGALHGVTRVREGLRYSLVCFFEHGHDLVQLHGDWGAGELGKAEDPAHHAEGPNGP